MCISSTLSISIPRSKLLCIRPRQKNHMIHYFLGAGTTDIAFLARLFKMHLNFRKYSIFDRRPASLPRKPRILGMAGTELVASRHLHRCGAPASCSDASAPQVHSASILSGVPLLFYLRVQVCGCIVGGCVFGLPTRPFLTVAP